MFNIHHNFDILLLIIIIDIIIMMMMMMLMIMMMRRMMMMLITWVCSRWPRAGAVVALEAQTHVSSLVPYTGDHHFLSLSFFMTFHWKVSHLFSPKELAHVGAARRCALLETWRPANTRFRIRLVVIHMRMVVIHIRGWW